VFSDDAAGKFQYLPSVNQQHH